MTDISCSHRYNTLLAAEVSGEVQEQWGIYNRCLYRKPALGYLGCNQAGFFRTLQGGCSAGCGWSWERTHGAVCGVICAPGRYLSAYALQKERFSENDVRGIFQEVQENVCSQCPQREFCWEENYYRTYRRAYGMLHAIEEEGDEMNQGRQEAFLELCMNGTSFLASMMESFRIAKLNLMWSNRLLENREAVAEQLYETASIMERAASTIYDVRHVDPGLEKQIDIKLRMHGILMRDIRGSGKDADRQELFITMRTNRKGRCVSTREVAAIISEVCSQRMVPDRDSRTIINRDYSTVLFLAEPAFLHVEQGWPRLQRRESWSQGTIFPCSAKKMVR